MRDRPVWWSLTTSGAVCLVLLATQPARGSDLQEVTVARSAAQDLYVRKRPPVPEAPRLPKILEVRLAAAEKQVAAHRRQAIGLLRQFLNSRPTGEGKAEGLFKLAELLWEDSKQTYFARLERYERKVEACRRQTDRCIKPPQPPELALGESERLYLVLLAEHPRFRRRDLVLYLVGFAARERGDIAGALGHFEQLIREHPRSPLYGDAWLMIGENHFLEERWQEARRAYLEVLKRPEAEGFDLALFKTAWCDWKLGDTDSAARRFKSVLDLAAEAERSGDERERKRRAQLREEALDYLVLVFVEDESIGSREVFDFLASIGGERYSQAVLVRLADTFFDQGEHERAVEAYRFLIERAPLSPRAPTYQRRIVDSYQAALEGDKAMAELKVLVEDYATRSRWTRANKSQPRTVQRAYRSSESLVRTTAKGFHADAQELERAQKRPDRERYTRAAATYAFYLQHFSRDPHAAEIRFLRAEILFFKLGQLEQAGDQYLAVGRSTPVGKYHRDALLKAMEAYRKLRPSSLAKQRQLVESDRKFAEAIDLYATLFPADPKLVGVIFENGQLFYDYGDYDEAIKRFGLIVTKYPDDPNAGAAGDRLLDALNRAEDYENIEHWARKLLGAKAFQDPKQVARLERLIVEAIGKSGERLSAAGDHEKAASFYLRIPVEYPNHPLAPQATLNAAVNLERAKRPEQAADTYLRLVERYPTSPLAETAAFTAAQVYESMAYYERAAEAFELTAKKYPNSEKGGDALFNAGVLRQALGQPKRAIAHYERYADKYRRSKADAEEVAFRVGVVYEDAEDEGRAERAYNAYLKRYPDGKYLIEATVRSGRAAYRLGHDRRASKQFETALKTFGRLRGESRTMVTRWAAEARYLQGELIYRSYDKISLDVPPRKLDRTLADKMRLLDQASDVFLEVVEFGDPQWSTAALYRIGSVMEEFATSLRDAPTPKGLSADEEQLYRDALDEEVITIEEKAIELYRTGYQKALSLRVYNSYTRDLRRALGRMAASRFPPMKESHEEQRMRQPKLEPALVTEVIRDE